jgi:RNA polymerase sigma factor (sigma-70 family)
MTEMLEGTRAPSDPELISGVRSGDLHAYGELFSRHVDAALRLARQLTRGSDAEDLVSEAFTKVMGILTEGGGPDVAFRTYLLTAVRRLYVDRVRTDSRLANSGDMTAFDPGVPFQDTVVAEFESSAAARAFATLPERWQLVLWHLEVENQKPADIAPLLGMSANSVSALAYRAREGLRQAFLSAHLADTSDADCRWTVEHLGGYVREGLAKRDRIKVKAHLDACRSCTAMCLELTEVNSDLRGIIAPLLLGTAAAGYLAGVGSSAGVSAFLVLLGRARDALFGASGTSASATTGATTGATAGASAGAVGGTSAGTMAGSTAATMGATAAGTTTGAAAATTAAATTAAATTAAGVTTGGAVAGVAAGATGGVMVGAAVAGAATGVTAGVGAGVGAAGLAMIAVGTAGLTLGIGAAPQGPGSGLPTAIPGATSSVSPNPSSVPSSTATVPEQVDPTPPPDSPPSPDAAALDMPSPLAESTMPSGEPDDANGQAGEPSGSPALPDIDTAPDDVVTPGSDSDENPTDEPSATPEPDPSPTPSDSPDDAGTPSPDSVSTPPDGSTSSPVVPMPSSSPTVPPPPPDVSPDVGTQLPDPSEGPTP